MRTYKKEVSAHLNTEDDIVMRTYKKEVSAHLNIRNSKLRWSDVIRKDTEENGVERRSTEPGKVEHEDSQRRPQIGKGPRKICRYVLPLEQFLLRCLDVSHAQVLEHLKLHRTIAILELLNVDKPQVTGINQ